MTLLAYPGPCSSTVPEFGVVSVSWTFNRYYQLGTNWYYYEPLLDCVCDIEDDCDAFTPASAEYSRSAANRVRSIGSIATPGDFYAYIDGCCGGLRFYALGAAWTLPAEPPCRNGSGYISGGSNSSAYFFGGGSAKTTGGKYGVDDTPTKIKVDGVDYTDFASAGFLEAVRKWTTMQLFAEIDAVEKPLGVITLTWA